MENDPPNSGGAEKSPGPAVDSQLVATAYHESGHAVMATTLGRQVQKVSILPAMIQSGGRRLGACELKKDPSKTSKDWLEDEVLILFAGMVAEGHFTGQYCESGANSDLRAIRRLLQSRASSERQLERLEKRLLNKTEHVLGSSVQIMAIEQIASELIAKEKISGRTVRHIFDQAMKSGGD